MGQNRQPRSRTSRAKQRGFALVVVLWAGALLAMLATAIAQRARDDVVLTRNLVDSTEAELAADSGVHYAVERALVEGPETFLESASVHEWEFNGAEIRISVTDEMARIDLNAATVPMITRLFAAAGAGTAEAASLAAAVEAYRSRSMDDPLAGSGTPGRRTVGFATVEELMNIDGMTRALFNRLSGSVTVFTGRRRPNLDYASPLVITTIAGDAADEAADDSAQSRLRGASGNSESDSGSTRTRRARGNHLLRFHVEARTAGGSIFAREAIVVIRLRRAATGHEFWLWRRGQRRLF